MAEAAWQGLAPTLAQDKDLVDAVLAAHRETLCREMSGVMGLNPSLPVQARAFRRLEGWRVLLLLTPWMLSRLLFPDEPPPLAIPAGWTATARRSAEYCMLGPRVPFQLLGQQQQGHLNFHPVLGHYLLQPICLDMEPYSDAEAVFEAWDRVIRVRDENMERARRNCPLQKEISRRELFRRSHS